MIPGVDIQTIIRVGGYIGLFAIIFAESGLFVGFFLPGDSLLFTAGFLASQNVLHIWYVIGIVFIAAVLGDNVGYVFGRRIGPKLFYKEDSFFFHKDHLKRAEKFYEEHGPKTIVIARFMPIVRTFAPIVAGIGKMHYTTFFIYNVVGGVLWGIGIPLAGYFLGQTIPNIDHYLAPIIIGIIIASIAPGFYHVAKEYRAHKRAQKDNS